MPRTTTAPPALVIVESSTPSATAEAALVLLESAHELVVGHE
jgi:hypothetical protein